MLTNSNFYIGDSSVSRLYQGETLVWDSSHPDILLEYISNGDASTNPDVYFNTSVAPDLTLKVETKYSYHNRNYAGGTALFGSRASATDSRYYLFTFAGLQIDGQNLYTAKFWFKNLEGYSAVVPTLDEPHVITTCATYSSASSATAVNCILDGSTTSRAVTINQALSNTHQMYMFAMNNQGTVEYRCLADTRIYYMKIWRDNNLIRFYIPVLHYINGQYTPCFYDKVNNTYIYNLGTDTPTYKISGDYLLDYIANGPDASYESRATVDYNTGLSITTSLQTYAGVSTVNLSNQENRNVGIRGNSSNYKWGFYTPYNNNFQYKLGYQTNLNGIATSSAASNQKYNLGGYYNSTEDKVYFHVDSSVYSTALNGRAIDISGLEGYTIRTWDGGSFNGNKIYYMFFADANVPLKSYIPVLHNSQPAFLDLNSNTYIYNFGTDTPLYSFQK